MAVVADSKVKQANRKTQGNNPGSGSYIPQGPLTMIGNGINRINTGIGTGIDRVFDATLGNAVRALTNDSVDPTQWLSGEDVGTGLDIIEDIGLGMVSVPALVAKVLAQNSEGLTESILGVDAETGQDLDMKQRALKGLSSVGNVALSAVPGVGKAMKAGGKAIGKAGEDAVETALKKVTEKNASELASKEQALDAAQKAFEDAKAAGFAQIDSDSKRALKAIKDARESNAALRPWEMSADDLLRYKTGKKKFVNPYEGIEEYAGTDIGEGFKEAIKNTQKSIGHADQEISDLQDWINGYGKSKYRMTPGPDGKLRRRYLADAQQELADKQMARESLPAGLEKDIQRLEKAARKAKKTSAKNALAEELNGEVEGVRKNLIEASKNLDEFSPADTSGMQSVLDALAGKTPQQKSGFKDIRNRVDESTDVYDRIATRLGDTADMFREEGFGSAVKTLTGRNKQAMESVTKELGDKISHGQALTAEEQASLRNLMEVAQKGNTDAAKALNKIMGKDVFPETPGALDDALTKAQSELEELEKLKGTDKAPTKEQLKDAQEKVKAAQKAARKEGNKASNRISKSMENGGRGITRGAIDALGDTLASGLNAEANYRAENPGGSLFRDDPGLLFASVLSGLLGGRRLARNLPGMRGLSQNGFGGVRSNIPYGAISAAAMGTAGANRQDVSQLDPAVLSELNKMYGYNLNSEE